MKILIDECIPRKFKGCLPNHECQTAPEAGLAGKKNGELLSLAERAGFRVLVTMDKGIEYEQDLRGRNIGVLLIRARSNRLADLLPLAADCAAAIRAARPGQVVRIGG
ncbi:MAG TPA: DUF5615 family PIN-like protein [Bryobacteraceae bacterium]|jgi:predicted nuclease of predicted toxin-antitoxin system|nr:DUF5615 family PIN-like protein [Bryobacteraceae bacterium]